MKKVLIIITTLVALACAYNTFNGSQSVTKAEFNATHDRLKRQIDSILQNCDSLKTELRQVKANTDTLKAGQDVIYRTMQENTERRSIMDILQGR